MEQESDHQPRDKPTQLRLFIFSDLHLEFIPDDELDAYIDTTILDRLPIHGLDLLILAGDIAHPKQLAVFFKKLEQWFKDQKQEQTTDIIYVTGNHEYYDPINGASATRLQERDDELRLICIQYPQIHMLQRETITIKGLTIVGCTLWSEIQEPEYRQLNDSRFVFKNMKQYEEAFTTDLTWLTQTLHILRNQPVLVVTHHLPSVKCVHSAYRSDPHTGFYSDLEHLFTSNIKLWVFGHQHNPMWTMINGIPAMSNPIGYRREPRQVSTSWTTRTLNMSVSRPK
jgi:predicted phosphodiesterase